jgi:hypothetical protein
MSDYYEYDSGDNVLLGRQGSPDDGYDSTKGKKSSRYHRALPLSLTPAQAIPLDPSRRWFHHPVQHPADERYRPGTETGLRQRRRRYKPDYTWEANKGKLGLTHDTNRITPGKRTRESWA